MQERLCREVAAHRGWKIAEVYTDRDRTAAGRDPFRPEYQRMCQDIKAGQIDGVVALDQDRLVREPYELEVLLRLCEDVGLTHIMTSEGDLNISTGGGLMEARIRAAVAKEEIEKMKKRHRRAQADLARAGRHGGGYRPFGYDADGVGIRKDEAALLRDAAKRVLLGVSEQSIADEWNAKGITTTQGAQWSGQRLRAKLQQPRYVGLRVHHGEVVGPAVWKPIFSEATWAALVAHYESRPAPEAGHPPREYVGSGVDGLFRCGICEQPVRARPRTYKGESVRSYVCVHLDHPKHRNKAGFRIDADPVEEHVAKDVIASIDEDAWEAALRAEAGQDHDRQRLVQQLGDAERALTTAEERYLEGGVSKRAFDNVRARQESTIKDLRRRLNRSEKSTILLSLPRSRDALLAKYEAETVEWKRAFLSTFVEAVYLMPAAHRGQKFTEDRVVIVPHPEQRD